MKRIAWNWLFGMVVVGALVLPSIAQTESLGDYAREVRKERAKEPPASKKFDNDNLPRNESLSVVGNAPAEPDKAAQDNSAQDSKDKSDASKDDEEKAKAEKEWKDKLAAQKDQISLLSRELDVLQREYRLRAAAFYADAGDRLRNSGKWDQQDKQYKQQIADKQKTLDDANKQLADMEEQARRAGEPEKARQ